LNFFAIFLSIGYSTCHWCHVLEHESFEDPEVTITFAGSREGLGEMLRTFHRRYLPGLAVRHASPDGEAEYPAVDGRPTAYVCARGACRPPVVDAGALAALLDEVG
jgi:uncharacterized protein YyaL (SSP411 family)